MSEAWMRRFFGVVASPRTWLSVLFHVLAFPLGLFYFVFLVVGLSVGLGLVVIWVGLPILLVVVGAWWLFGAFERLQAKHLLCADVPAAPQPWASATGVWGKVKAHFGSGSTWKDLAYLLAKLPFGVVSFSLLVTLAAIGAWLVAFPIAWRLDIHLVSWGNGDGWTPPLWLAVLGVPGAVLWFVASLHIVNAWSWVCRSWAELLFRVDESAVPAAVAAPAPLVSTSPQPRVAAAPTVLWPPPVPAAPAPPAAPAAFAAPAPPAAPSPPAVSQPSPAPEPSIQSALPADESAATQPTSDETN